MKALLEIVMTANTVLFFFGAVQHAGFVIGRFHEPRIVPAAIVEALCGLSLACGVVVVVRGARFARRTAVITNLIALFGVLVGIAALALGAGPRTASNDLYHKVMLVFIASALVLLSFGGRARIIATHNSFVKWIGLNTVVAPILFVLFFTIAGFLRPGYSPIHQAISDLGVGAMPLLLNIPLVVLGLSLVLFAASFVYVLRAVMSRGWRWVCGIFVAGPGLGYATAGIFPETNPIHWKAGMPFLAIGSVVGFLLVGIRLRRIRQWRNYGIYSLIAGLVTAILIMLMNMAFTPGSAYQRLHLGGLAERVAFVEILAWYVVMGWLLFREPESFSAPA